MDEAKHPESETGKTTLRNNIIPRGLTIKTSLQAEDADQPLHRKWNNIIHGTQIKLMKLLKDHHRDTSNMLYTS